MVVIARLRIEYDVSLAIKRNGKTLDEAERLPLCYRVGRVGR